MQQPNLVSVELLYCRKSSGQVWKKEVDIPKVGGLYWGGPCRPKNKSNPKGCVEIRCKSSKKPSNDYLPTRRIVAGKKCVVAIDYPLAADCVRPKIWCPRPRGLCWWSPKAMPTDTPRRAPEIKVLLSVEITYGDDSGQMWKKEVNLDRVSAIFWGVNGGLPNAGFPKISTKSQTSIEGASVRPPPPNGPSCCWYDPTTGTWYCPTGF